MAKRFFFICAGILCLAFAYHLGAQSAVAQSGTGHIKDVVPLTDREGNLFLAFTDQDDIYTIDRTKVVWEARGTGWQRFRLGNLR
ncbi:MAG: hypothetical protein ACRENS_03655 [Candidatus Eiseniibacteriota bacterium]